MILTLQTLQTRPALKQGMSGAHKADPTRSARKSNPVRTYILNMEPDAPTKPPKRKRLRSLKDLIDSLPETQFLKEHGMAATTEKHRLLASQ